MGRSTSIRWTSCPSKSLTTDVWYARRMREAYKQAWYTKNKDRILEERKAYNAARRLPPESVEGFLRWKFSRWQTSAKLRKLAWNIEFAHVTEALGRQRNRCFYSGVELSFCVGHPHVVSLDRKDSSEGYTPSNIVLCSSSVNVMKSELSCEVFVDLCSRVSAIGAPV